MSMSGTSSVELQKGLTIGYKSNLATVVESLELKDGTHYLLARNGRGKTTLLRTIATVLAARAGSFLTKGKMQFVPEDISYNDHLRPIDVFKCLIPKSRRSECLKFAKLIELDVRKPYRALSTGNQRKVSWLMAEFSCNPTESNILLLDEPFTGLDSFVREKIMEYWDANKTGVCRLVSCHPDFDSMSIDSAVLISDGKISSPSKDELHSWGELKGQLS